MVHAGRLDPQNPSKTDVALQLVKMLNSQLKIPHHAADHLLVVSPWDVTVDNHPLHCNGWQKLAS